MSHELRTPLNSLLILAKSFMTNNEGNLTEKQIEKAKVIHEGGMDLLTLINDILDLTKVEAGKLDILIEEISIVEIFNMTESLFAPTAEEKGLNLVVDIEEGVGANLESDSQRIGQILKNLMSNALKFTSEGNIILRAFTPNSGIKYRNSNLKTIPMIGISISDSGIVIPKDKQKDIFEAFQQAEGSTTRDFGGTGLGLTISRELSRLLGGEIHLESKVNKGSVFTLYLPVKHAVELESEKDISIKYENNPPVVTPIDILECIADDRNNIVKNDKTILIIEDDVNFAKTLQSFVSDQDCKTIVTTSGIEGLKLAEKYKPKAIILDLGLPDISGEVVLNQLKASLGTRHIPVHIISAEDKDMKLIQNGAVGFSSKPTSEEEINNILGDLIDFGDKKEKPILIIDDDQMQQDAISELLSFNGIILSHALSGKEALEIISTKEWRCVILDLQLGDMSGFELLKELNKTRSELPPIIVHSAKDLTKKEFKTLNKFTDRIVVKGASSPERLLNEVSMFLHSLESSLSTERKKMISLVNDANSELKGKTAVVVDDDVRNIFSMTDLLEGVGMKVISAENGKEGIEMLKKNKNINVVLMDIMMPVMNGYETMISIRKMKSYQKLPIIALTAKAMADDRAKCIEAGASDYLTKPINEQTLFTLIRVWLYSN